MVFYIERKRRRPDGEKSSSSVECQVFECETWTKTTNKGSGSRKASRNTVRLIPKPPEFTLSQPPNPFDILNDEKNHPLIDARDKFLLYYLNHNELTTKTTNHDVDAIRDKCNSLKIQLLAGTSDYAKLLPSHQNSHHNNNNANTQLSGAAGYNYIRSKIVPNSDSNSNGSSSSYWFGSSNNRTANNNVLLKINQSPTPRVDDSISKNVNSANSYNSFSSSNLFSSFLYSFSILFVLFIFVFFIYLYYSR